MSKPTYSSGKRKEKQARHLGDYRPSSRNNAVRYRAWGPAKALRLPDLVLESHDLLFFIFDLDWDLRLKSEIITPSAQHPPLWLPNSVTSPINISSTSGRCFGEGGSSLTSCQWDTTRFPGLERICRRRRQHTWRNNLTFYRVFLSFLIKLRYGLTCLTSQHFLRTSSCFSRYLLSN